MERNITFDEGERTIQWDNYSFNFYISTDRPTLFRNHLVIRDLYSAIITESKFRGEIWDTCPEDHYYIEYTPKESKLIFETNRTKTFFVLKSNDKLDFGELLLKSLE